MGAARCDQSARFVPFVAAEIVEYDDIARLERRCEDAFDMDAEDGAVHGTVDDERRDDPDTAQGGDEGGGLPVSLRHPADQTRPPPASAVGPRHLAQVSSMKTSRLGSNGG